MADGQMVMHAPWQTGAAVDSDTFQEVRREAIFECCKWDPQVEDVATLAPYPLILNADTWTELARLAVQLARETFLAEAEILQRPELVQGLGFSRPIRKVLEGAHKGAAQSPSVRVMRFDFHLTTEGWRISEANTDVPGGYNEATGFTRLMARFYPGGQMCGDPVQELGQSIRSACGQGATVALVHATGFSDDRQVATYLARQWESAGLRAVLVAPDHVQWRQGKAFIETEWFSDPVDFLFRFFPGEWLPNLGRRSEWQRLFTPTRPVCNPAAALVSQNKRWPLLWPQMAERFSTWQQLLPESREPAEVCWSTDAAWVVKPALGRVGDMVGIHGIASETEWQQIRRSLFWHPKQWVAQRRFEPIPIQTPEGPMFACLGVFTVGERAAGVYGRISPQPLINQSAREMAVFCRADRASERI